MLTRSIITVILGHLSTLVAAQIGDLDPSTVSLSVKAQWCTAQSRTCPLLCSIGGKSNSNKCDASTLKFDCTCANGTAPGLKYYTGTMPTFICLQVYTDCISEAQGDAAGREKCTEARDANCGSLDPSKIINPGTLSGADTSTSPPTSAITVSSSSSAAAVSKPIPTPEPLGSSSTSSIPSSVSPSTSSSDALVKISPPTITSEVLSTVPSSPGTVSTSSSETSSSGARSTISSSPTGATVTNNVATTVVSTISNAGAASSSAPTSTSQSAAGKMYSSYGVVLSACMLIVISGTVLAC